MRTLNYIIFFLIILTSCKSNSSKINDFSVLMNQSEANVDKLTEDEINILATKVLNELISQK